jgi:hypothetical protein
LAILARQEEIPSRKQSMELSILGFFLAILARPEEILPRKQSMELSILGFSW